MKTNGKFMAPAARRKLGKGDDWEPCIFEAIGTDATLIKGGVPGRFKRGPRAGDKKWPPARELDVVVLVESEIVAEMLRYEAETGNCANCEGRGQELAGWKCDTGNYYRPCSVCGATGKADAIEDKED